MPKKYTRKHKKHRKHGIRVRILEALDVYECLYRSTDTSIVIVHIYTNRFIQKNRYAFSKCRKSHFLLVTAEIKCVISQEQKRFKQKLFNRRCKGSRGID